MAVEVDKSDISGLTWMKVPWTNQLAVRIKDGLKYKFIGFRDQVAFHGDSCIVTVIRSGTNDGKPSGVVKIVDFGEVIEDKKNNVVEPVKDEKIALLGAIQSLFEGSMYTFVFLWTPALSLNGEDIPHGFIFATFMLSSMLGSYLASWLLAHTLTYIDIVHTLLKGLEKIIASADIPMFVCGDFNSVPRRYVSFLLHLLCVLCGQQTSVFITLVYVIIDPQ
uniref:FACT complex subunit SSRP1/POB3 N-terminal PH domain-containing protein n=1 Tax=Lactuca sativa TaxID=4236 RepID=A0A9R1W317_LACSA|nr:hypothetical protein LSAT_V11C300120900 [Lactuca sativa]